MADVVRLPCEHDLTSLPALVACVSTRRIRALVVEDVAANRAMLTRMLTRTFNAAVADGADDGSSALQLLGAVAQARHSSRLHAARLTALPAADSCALAAEAAATLLPAQEFDCWPSTACFCASSSSAPFSAAPCCTCGAGYDVIFTDKTMPVMDGLEATRRLRAGGFRGPIIAVTGDANDCDDLLAAGVNDIILKPASKQALADALHRSFVW